VILCLLGAAAGAAAVAFHSVTLWIEARTIRAATELDTIPFLLVSMLCVVGGSLVASFLVRRFSPESAGGGVLPTKLSFWHDFGCMKARTFLAKFAASALTLGTGTSMGPEGPAVQIGAGVMSSGAGFLGLPKQARRSLCAGGAAAGLAAAFNAPLAAITFVLEEIIGDLNSRYLGTVVLAAVMGALVSHALLGDQPAFQVSALEEPGWFVFLLCVPVAAVSAAAGACFQRGALWLRGRMRTWTGLPLWSRPVVGAFLSWGFAAVAFLGTGHAGVFGIGYQDVTLALGGQIAWGTALFLCAAKLCATTAAVGSSGCGGIFAPSFFIGAMCGATLSGLISLVHPLSSGEQSMLVMVGMCASLGAVIRTPIACILMIFEVTHQFFIVPALLIATVLSQGVARLVQREGMYEAMLKQDGGDPNRLLPPRHYKQWREMPVNAIACFRPVVAATTESNELGDLLRRSPFQRFPVVSAGTVLGVLFREDAERSVVTGKEPRLREPVWIEPLAPLSEAQRLMLENDSDFLCIGDPVTRNLLGVVTLHDLLRGQDALVEETRA